MSGLTLERTQVVPSDLPTVFAFFKRPENLERLTPPWLNFRILYTSHPEVRAGTRISYRLRLNGIPLTWESVISRFEENVLFVDEQIEGPFRAWTHRHEFESLGDRTRLTDRVTYQVRGGPLVNLLAAWIVTPGLHQMFRHRHRVTRQQCEAR